MERGTEKTKVKEKREQEKKGSNCKQNGLTEDSNSQDVKVQEQKEAGNFANPERDAYDYIWRFVKHLMLTGVSHVSITPPLSKASLLPSHEFTADTKPDVSVGFDLLQMLCRTSSDAARNLIAPSILQLCDELSIILSEPLCDRSCIFQLLTSLLYFYSLHCYKLVDAQNQKIITKIVTVVCGEGVAQKWLSNQHPTNRTNVVTQQIDGEQKLKSKQESKERKEDKGGELLSRINEVPLLYSLLQQPYRLQLPLIELDLVIDDRVSSSVSSTNTTTKSNPSSANPLQLKWCRLQLSLVNLCDPESKSYADLIEALKDNHELMARVKREFGELI